MIGPDKGRNMRGALGAAGMKDSGMGAQDFAGDDTEDTSGGAEATVPIDSLSADGTPPSVGDTVKFSIEGVVQNISGGNAEIEINSVDGEAVGGNASAGDTGESTSAMGDRLRSKAMASDNAGGGGY